MQLGGFPSPILTLLGLEDGPGEYDDGLFLKSTADGWEWAAITWDDLDDIPELIDALAEGELAFTDLADTFATYTGSANALVQVNAAEDALAPLPFPALAGNGGLLLGLDDELGEDADAVIARSFAAWYELNGLADAVIYMTDAATDDAAGHKTLIEAAITAVGASAGSPKRVTVIGEWKWGGTAAYAASDYVKWNLTRCTHNQVGNANTVIIGTGTEITGGHLKYTSGASGGTDINFAFAKLVSGSWRGGHVEGINGGLFYITNSTLDVVVQSFTTACTGEMYGSQSGGVPISGSVANISGVGMSALSVGYASNAIVSRVSGTLTVRDDSSSATVGQCGTLSVTGTDSVGTCCRANTVTVSGVHAHVTSRNASASQTATQSGDYSTLDCGGDTGGTTTTVNLSMDAGTFILQGERFALSTNTATKSAINVRTHSNDVTARTYALGTANDVVMRLVRSGKLTLGDATGGTLDLHMDGASGDALEFAATYDNAKASVTLTTSDAQATVKDGAVGNAFAFFGETEPVIEAAAKLANTLRYSYTGTAVPGLRWEIAGGIERKTLVELVTWTADGALSTTIKVPVGGSPLFARFVVQDELTGTSLDHVGIGIGGGMTTPITEIGALTLNTKVNYQWTTIQYADSGDDAYLTLLPAEAGEAEVTDTDGAVRCALTYELVLDLPDE